MCQMFGDETSPLGMGVGFWHLDGSHMDDDFAFSFYRTREEWEAENHRREEFDKEFNRRWEERQQRIARGEPLPGSPDGQPGWGGGAVREGARLGTTRNGSRCRARSPRVSKGNRARHSCDAG